MIISIGGAPGSGKSTVAKILAKKLGYDYYGAGRFRRDYAKELGITIEELNERAKTDPESDYLADEKLKEINGKDKIVADGWLAWHFIPDSFKVYLTAEEEVRAERIFNEKREEENFTTKEEAIEKMNKRYRVSEERYKKLYGVESISNLELFDFVVDTTNIMPEEAADIILGEIEKT